MKHEPIELTIAALVARGLIDEQRNLTEAGHAWVKSFVKAYPDVKQHRAHSSSRRRRNSER